MPGNLCPVRGRTSSIRSQSSVGQSFAHGARCGRCRSSPVCEACATDWVWPVSSTSSSRDSGARSAIRRSIVRLSAVSRRAKDPVDGKHTAGTPGMAVRLSSASPIPTFSLCIASPSLSLARHEDNYYHHKATIQAAIEHPHRQSVIRPAIFDPLSRGIGVQNLRGLTIFPAMWSMPCACAQCLPIWAAHCTWASSPTASSILTWYLDREGETPGRSAPALSHCRPDRCPNACITRRHLGPWQVSNSDGEEMLRAKRLSSLQREIITDDNERKRQLIAPLLERPPE